MGAASYFNTPVDPGEASVNDEASVDGPGRRSPRCGWEILFQSFQGFKW